MYSTRGNVIVIEDLKFADCKPEIDATENKAVLHNSELSNLIKCMAEGPNIMMVSDEHTDVTYIYAEDKFFIICTMPEGTFCLQIATSLILQCIPKNIKC